MALWACSYDTAPRYLLRDRDSIFGTDFVRRVESMGIEEVVTARARRGRIHTASVRSDRSGGSASTTTSSFSTNGTLLRVLRSYASYYNSSRTHRSLHDDCPDPRPLEPPEMGDVVALAQVGGLHHRYTRRLAA